MSSEPISETLLNQIHRESLKESEKRRESGYWIECPSCGKQVVKKELLKKGCYVCGWKGAEEKLTKIKKKQKKSYYTHCLKCGHKVVTEELEEKGCFICGYKPRTDDREQKTEVRI